jgi:hypothetical protein
VKATLVRQDAFDNGGGIRRGKRDIFDVWFVASSNLRKILSQNWWENFKKI